jgi:hypothetical protein
MRLLKEGQPDGTAHYNSSMTTAEDYSDSEEDESLDLEAEGAFGHPTYNAQWVPRMNFTLLSQ